MVRIERLAMVVSLSLIATGCGRKGPLLYPDMLVPAAPSAVTAMQSGSSVKLHFDLPDKDRAGRPVQGLVGVKVSKRTAEAAQANVCRACMTDYRLFRTLYLDHLPSDSQRFGSRMVLLDGDVNAEIKYSYSIVPFTAEGIDGASSAIAEVSVAAPLPAPVLHIESLPTELKLHISSQPVLSGDFLGYNIYRTSGTNSRSYQPHNREPLKGNEYIDSGLERGVKYHYSARTLILQKSGDVAESEGSFEVGGMLKDDE